MQNSLYRGPWIDWCSMALGIKRDHPDYEILGL